MLCNGHSALSLAIGSGNDLVSMHCFVLLLFSFIAFINMVSVNKGYLVFKTVSKCVDFFDSHFQAVETLLEHEADASLPLKCGVGSSLCAAISFTAEKRRKFVDRIRLVYM